MLPIPQSHIRECFEWRDFFNKLSIRVGSTSSGTSSVTSITRVVPVSGFNYQIGTEEVLILEPASVLASGTVVLPPGTDNRQVTIGLYKSITSFTISPYSGDTIVGPTTIGLTPSITYKFNLATRKWFAIG